MSKTPWHKRYHSDAIAGYMGLSLEERGAYSTILDYLYDRGEPLVGNMRLIAGYLDCSVRKATALVEKLVAKGKLERLPNGRITNPRFAKEVEKTAKTSDHMAEIGKTGGDKSAEARKSSSENNDSENPPLAPRSSYPEARSQKPEGKSRTEGLPLESPPSNKRHTPAPPAAKPPVLPDGFEEFWKTYPRRTDRKDALRAYQRAITKIPPADLLKAAAAFAKSVGFTEQRFIPHPATWLNKERWAEHLEPAQVVDMAASFEALVREKLPENWKDTIVLFKRRFGDDYEAAVKQLERFMADPDKDPERAKNCWFFNVAGYGNVGRTW